MKLPHHHHGLNLEGAAAKTGLSKRSSQRALAERAFRQGRCTSVRPAPLRALPAPSLSALFQRRPQSPFSPARTIGARALHYIAPADGIEGRGRVPPPPPLVSAAPQGHGRLPQLNSQYRPAQEAQARGWGEEKGLLDGPPGGGWRGRAHASNGGAHVALGTKAHDGVFDPTQLFELNRICGLRVHWRGSRGSSPSSRGPHFPLSLSAVARNDGISYYFDGLAALVRGRPC